MPVGRCNSTHEPTTESDRTAIAVKMSDRRILNGCREKERGAERTRVRDKEPRKERVEHSLKDESPTICELVAWNRRRTENRISFRFSSD